MKNNDQRKQENKEKKDKKLAKPENQGKPKNAKKYITPEQYNMLLEMFIEQFPGVFSRTNPKALKIGIHRDLLDHQGSLSSALVRKFLRRYCYTKQYRKTLVEGAPRYDLHGKVIDKVIVIKL